MLNFAQDEWNAPSTMGATIAAEEQGVDFIFGHPMTPCNTPLSVMDGLLTLFGAHFPRSLLAASCKNVPLLSLKHRPTPHSDASSPITAKGSV